MKNYLIGWQHWETEFNGDPITMMLLPLRRSEFLRILPVLDDFYKLSQANEEGVKNATGMGTMLDSIEQIVTGHVKDILGFEVDGAAPKVEDVLSGAVFMPLVSGIVFRLIEISKVDKVSEKNSEGQSASIQ